MPFLGVMERHLLISDVQVSEAILRFEMKDGGKIEVPLWWYPRLHAATPEQRAKWEILPFGDAVGWEEIDEYISAQALIIGGAAPGARPPAAAEE